MVDNSAAGPGALYYLVARSIPGGCGLTESYRESANGEIEGAGGSRDVDIAADPDACP